MAEHHQDVPAAQYLRMSTKAQPFSMENQALAIAVYAAAHHFVVTDTYADPGKSGLTLRERPGLRKLLSDVASGPPFRAILVYDVSRFGRFRNVDEAAHYEFMCRQAGVQIHYCSEPFSAEATPANSILKALKRYMAAEFARELGENVLRSHRRYFDQGFQRAGIAPYGLRREWVFMDVGSDAPHIAKSRKRHTRFILGPTHEIETVRLIFKQFVDGFTAKKIAEHLNRTGVPAPRAHRWGIGAIYRILRHPNYSGNSVWQMHSTVNSRLVKRPRAEWTLRPDSIPPIIDKATFEKVQQLIRPKVVWSKESALVAMRRILDEGKTLHYRAMGKANGCPSCQTIERLFGSWNQALRQLRIEVHHPNTWGTRIRSSQQIQSQLVQSLIKLFPDRLRECYEPSKHRHAVLLDGSILISVLVASRTVKHRQAYWRFRPPMSIRSKPSLFCLWDEHHQEIKYMYLLRAIPRTPYVLCVKQPCQIRDCQPVELLADFCVIAERTILTNSGVALPYGNEYRGSEN